VATSIRLAAHERGHDRRADRSEHRDDAEQRARRARYDVVGFNGRRRVNEPEVVHRGRVAEPHRYAEHGRSVASGAPGVEMVAGDMPVCGQSTLIAVL
jgi:hypothetical protein